MLSEKACKWFPQYKGILPPKCNCKPCHQKYEESKKKSFDVV